MTADRQTPDLSAHDWRPALIAFFMRRVHNLAEAEDLTQEVFIRLLNSNAGSSGLPEGYLFKIASNLLIDRARRNRVRSDYKEAVLRQEGYGVDTLDPFRITSDRAELLALVKCLTKLPERTRTILILFRLENMSQQMIAETFGISVSAVKKHIGRAMVALMASIRETS